MCKNKINKTGKDLDNEYKDLEAKLKSISARIIERAEDLVNKFPKAEIVMKNGVSMKAIDYWKASSEEEWMIKNALYIIKGIEKYNEKNSGIVQGDIKFD